MISEEPSRIFQVLIVEDDETMSKPLNDAFDQFNKGSLVLPGEIYIPPRILFQTKVCSNPNQLYDVLRGKPGWDVFVIDRRFNQKELPYGKEFFQKDWAKPILESLRDLQVNGIRIIWTAFPDPRNLIECMQLGAWDYIDKNAPPHEDPIISTVVSALQGLRQRDIWLEKEGIDQAGHKYVVENYGDIYPKYKGKFLALEKAQEPGKWERVADNPSLVGLYEDLEEAQKERRFVHITLIHE